MENLPRTQVNKQALVKAYLAKKEMQADDKVKVPNPSLTPARVPRSGVPPSSKLVHAMNMSHVLETGSVAGQACNDTQKKLSTVDTYTGMYKKRFDPNVKVQGSGELCTSPVRAIRMLNSTSVEKLTIPSRTSDYRSEVEWRLSLRPQFN